MAHPPTGVRQFDEEATMQLQKGEKRSLADLGIGGRCEVTVSFGLAGVDIAAFGLDAAKKIGDDRYVVLFSNSRSPNGEISFASLRFPQLSTASCSRQPMTTAPSRNRGP